MRRFAALAAMLLLAACATVENALPPSEAPKLKLTSVRVSFAPEPLIKWEEGMREPLAGANAITADQIAMAAEEPKFKEAVRNKLATRVREGLERNLRPKLAGSRPVRLEIVVYNFVVSSAVQRVVIGGCHFMIADATLVDASTGAPIVSHPKMNGTASAGQGWAGVAVDAMISGNDTDRVIDAYSQVFRNWLFR